MANAQRLLRSGFASKQEPQTIIQTELNHNHTHAQPGETNNGCVATLWATIDAHTRTEPLTTLKFMPSNAAC